MSTFKFLNWLPPSIVRSTKSGIAEEIEADGGSSKITW